MGVREPEGGAEAPPPDGQLTPRPQANQALMAPLSFAALGLPLCGRISFAFLVYLGARGCFRCARRRRVGRLALSRAGLGFTDLWPFLRGRIGPLFLARLGTRCCFRGARRRRVGRLVLSLARLEIRRPALRSFGIAVGRRHRRSGRMRGRLAAGPRVFHARVAAWRLSRAMRRLTLPAGGLCRAASMELTWPGRGQHSRLAMVNRCKL